MFFYYSINYMQKNRYNFVLVVIILNLKVKERSF